MGEQNEELGKVILGNTPGNNQITSLKIQQDLKHCFAQEVLKQIFEDLGEDYFSLLVDESCDVSNKEQMSVIIRYVDKYGVVKERFIGFVHVKETSTLTLKSGIDDLFSRHGLSLGKIRGQGYDGASTISGEFNGLRALILKENVSAFIYIVLLTNFNFLLWVLQINISLFVVFFVMVASITNIVCASSKRQDKLRESKKKHLEDIFVIGSGLNQELSLTRPGDTSWNSHYKTLDRLVTLYPMIMEVLKYVEETSHLSTIVSQAEGLQLEMKKYDFVFYLHLMLHILDVTNLLSQCLQRKEQDLLIASSLVSSTKRQLEDFRLEGYNKSMENDHDFCEKHDVLEPKMVG